VHPEHGKLALVTEEWKELPQIAKRYKSGPDVFRRISTGEVAVMYTRYVINI
jgi:hypothetical protein